MEKTLSFRRSKWCLLANTLLIYKEVNGKAWKIATFFTCRDAFSWWLKRSLNAGDIFTGLKATKIWKTHNKLKIIVLISPVSSLCTHRNQIFVRLDKTAIKEELRSSEIKTEDLLEIITCLYYTICSMRNISNASHQFYTWFLRGVNISFIDKDWQKAVLIPFEACICNKKLQYFMLHKFYCFHPISDQMKPEPHLRDSKYD